MKKHLGIVVLALVIVLILVLYWVSFTVRYQEKALVLTLGKIARVETEPGLKWKAPWQRAIKLDCRIRTYQPAMYEMTTKDKGNIIVGLYVNWQIKDPVVFYNRFPHGGVADQQEVVASAEDAIKGWLGAARSVFAEYDLGELVTLNKERFKFADIHKSMLERVRAQAGAAFGIEILDLGIRKLGVPDSVSQSVFTRMKEDRAAEERRLLAEGQANADVLVGRAEGMATRIRAEAESKARSIEGQGDAEAAQFYGVFLEHPQLANFLRQLETLRKTLSERTTIILDGKTPPYQLLNKGPDIKDKATKE